MARLFSIFIFLVTFQSLYSQSVGIPVLVPPKTYPQIINYFSVVVPIVSFASDATTYNFDNSTTIMFPIGINVIRSEKFGISFEVAPFIKMENGTSKVSNYLFHPGFIFRYLNGYAITTRLAFETAGRFGSTIVFSKVITKNKTNNFYAAIPIPIRFGNDRPASIGLNFQLGVIF